MNEVRCPTCDRMLVRENRDGSFDLGGEARITVEASITEEQARALAAGETANVSAQATAMPLSARCLRCHPEPAPARVEWSTGFEVGLPAAPPDATGWSIYRTTHTTVEEPLRGWRRWYARLRRRPRFRVIGHEDHHTLVDRVDLGDLDD